MKAACIALSEATGMQNLRPCPIALFSLPCETSFLLVFWSTCQTQGCQCTREAVRLPAFPSLFLRVGSRCLDWQEGGRLQCLDQAPGSQFLQPCVDGRSEVERLGWADRSIRVCQTGEGAQTHHTSGQPGSLEGIYPSGALRVSWICGLVSTIILDSLALPPVVETGELPTALACTGFQS